MSAQAFNGRGRFFDERGERVKTEAEARFLAVCYEDSDRGWRRTWEWGVVTKGDVLMSSGNGPERGRRL